MADGDSDLEVHDIEIHGIIGFDGKIVCGLRVHPGKEHVIFPLGNKVCILHWHGKKQEYLSGHTNLVSAIDVSATGKYIASGQINHIGFKSWVILWDFEKRAMLSKHELHKVRVEAVAFSCDDCYLVSLGGRDCGNVVVWDIEKGAPLCGSAATRGTQGEAYFIMPTHRRGPCFLTGGDNNMVAWVINRHARNVHAINFSVTRIKRVIYCMDLDERDEICYCGTSTGDVLKVRMNFHHDVEVLEPVKPPMMIGCFSKVPRKKLPKGAADLYGSGVRSIMLLRTGILIGAGDGTFDLVKERKITANEIQKELVKSPSMPVLTVIRSCKVRGAITSIQFISDEDILIGTANCEIYSVNMHDFDPKLLVTCHVDSILSVAFPKDFSEVFATAGNEDVRVWNLNTFKEMLRIRVPNFICSCVCFSYDGKSILTAWNDGIIRSFTPQTGRLIYGILNAHNKGVSALDTTKDGKTIISGGCEGQVRIWDISPIQQQLLCTLKEHKGPVSAVHINRDGDEAASASTDGTVIIWDVVRQCRKQILFANTLFMCVKYYPTGVQILTGGTDRKLSYWEVLDGCLVRELEGSPSGAINTLDISFDGSLFVTGGNDQVVKLWKYQEGITTHIGLGHSAVITATAFSPNGKYIVSTSASGSIFIWKNPINIWDKEAGGDNEDEKESEPNTEEETIQNLVEEHEEKEKKVCCKPFKMVIRRPVGKKC